MVTPTCKFKSLVLSGLALSLTNISVVAYYFSRISYFEEDNNQVIQDYLLSGQTIGFHLAILTLIADGLLTFIFSAEFFLLQIKHSNSLLANRLSILHSVFTVIKTLSGVGSHIQDEIALPCDKIKDICSSQNNDNACLLIEGRKIFISFIYITSVFGCVVVIALYCINKKNNCLSNPDDKDIGQQQQQSLELKKPLSATKDELQQKKLNSKTNNDNNVNTFSVEYDDAPQTRSIRKAVSESELNVIFQESNIQHTNIEQQQDISIQKQLKQFNKVTGDTHFSEQNFPADQNFLADSAFQSNKILESFSARTNQTTSNFDSQGKQKASEIGSKGNNNPQNYSSKKSNFQSNEQNQEIKQNTQNQQNMFSRQSSIRSKQQSMRNYAISRGSFSWLTQSNIASNYATPINVSSMNFSVASIHPKRASVNIFKGLDCPPSPIRTLQKYPTFDNHLPIQKSQGITLSSEQNPNIEHKIEISDCYDESTIEQIPQDQLPKNVLPNSNTNRFQQQIRRTISLQDQDGNAHYKNATSQQISEEEEEDKDEDDTNHKQLQQSSVFESSMTDESVSYNSSAQSKEINNRISTGQFIFQQSKFQPINSNHHFSAVIYQAKENDLKKKGEVGIASNINK